MIPYGRQEITDADIEAVVKVLRSDYLTQGPAVPKFEATVAEYVGCNYAVAVNSATSALHIAYKALGLGSGDWLWTSPVTFVATANCALYCGARVDFVDIDPRTYNMCPASLEAKLAEAEISGMLPKIVVPVHLAGQSCDMAAIHALSKRYGFKIVEDASHAIGGKYKNEPIGRCSYSDIVVFSFHPVKIVTTGEGGMALTNTEELSVAMNLLRSHGITRERESMKRPSAGPWYYEQLDLGFNYRLTDVQAALGCSQMVRLDRYVNRRNEIAATYNEALGNLPLTLPWQNPDCHSAYHLYVIRILSQKIQRSHLHIFEQLRSRGISVNLHYIPVHLQPFYAGMGFETGAYPNAESYYGEAISLPMFPSLTEENQCVVIDALTELTTG